MAFLIQACHIELAMVIIRPLGNNGFTALQWLVPFGTTGRRSNGGWCHWESQSHIIQEDPAAVAVIAFHDGYKKLVPTPYIWSPSCRDHVGL